ncbi:MAG: hypothetical protein LBH19_06060 [Dysgonamonadaceae bacterium]|jgi:hypothetical protein|nr:hypothetical protein [Dysgonamonadaceae bacterium]
MKNILKYIGLSVAAITLMLACSEERTDRNLGSKVNASDIKVSVTPDAKDPNLIHFELLTPNSQALFECPEVGIKASGIGFSQKILWAGNYTLQVTAYNKAGVTAEKVSVPFNVATTDPSVCSDETFRLLTGGCGTETGKTWRLRTDINGAIGCGDQNADNNNWWAPPASELGSFAPALFDDDITFFLNSSQQVILNNKGGSFMNADVGAKFPEGGSGDYVTTHYVPKASANWAIVERDGSKWLKLVDVFPCYGVNESMIDGATYKIFELTETSLHIAYIPGGISWHYYFTSEPR